VTSPRKKGEILARAHVFSGDPVEISEEFKDLYEQLRNPLMVPEGSSVWVKSASECPSAVLVSRLAGRVLAAPLARSRSTLKRSRS
jgi:hypothetical protein